MPLSLDGTRTVEVVLRNTVPLLRGVSESPKREALFLLAHVLATSRESLLAHPERLLSEDESRRFAELIERRARGVPIPYLVGQQAFSDRTVLVTPDVLIPRPETELLVDQAINWVRQLLISQPIHVLDVGTGSGAIAVTLAAALNDMQRPSSVVGVDLSAAALKVAARNAASLSNIRFVQANLIDTFAGRFEIIAANLPYIPTEALSTLDVAHHEPLLALDGGVDGLRLIRQLLESAPDHLATPGLMMIEHGADQGQAVLSMARQAFPNDTVTPLKDDAGLDRVIRIERG